MVAIHRAHVNKTTTKKMHRYTKDALLALASLPSCQLRLDGIDPVLLRYVATTLSEFLLFKPTMNGLRGL